MNKRSPGQKLINFSADEEFIEAIEEGRKLVHETRSLFIRKAIAAKLQTLGIDFDDSQVFPPDRARPSTREGKPAEARAITTEEADQKREEDPESPRSTTEGKMPEMQERAKRMRKRAAGMREKMDALRKRRDETLGKK